MTGKVKPSRIEGSTLFHLEDIEEVDFNKTESVIEFAKENPELVKFINDEISYMTFNTAFDAVERITGDSARNAGASAPNVPSVVRRA